MDAVPARLATEVWQRIVDLVAPTNQASRNELHGVAGIAASLITREAMKTSPVIVAGDGPRVRVYCIYGSDAIEGEKANEASLPSSPAETDAWTLSLPCPADDLEWISASLKKRSSRVTARDLTETDLPEAVEEARSASTATINVESFLQS
ncbi:MAG TPA: hypothetical protein VGQ65_11615 [Thermoanaerobaculia bacterium]|nr:hypothetical protein [Thermoanaerobaculia bacterium]